MILTLKPFVTKRSKRSKDTLFTCQSPLSDALVIARYVVQINMTYGQNDFLCVMSYASGTGNKRFLAGTTFCSMKI